MKKQEISKKVINIEFLRKIYYKIFGYWNLLSYICLMKTFNLRLKPFDIFVMIMCAIMIIGAMIKGKVQDEEIYYFYAFLAFICGTIYVKAAGLSNDS